MKLLIHGRNLEVTPAIKEYTQSKVEKALQHFEAIVKEADVHLSVTKNSRVSQQIAEVTVFANGTVIRAQERSESLYSSIDLVASKLCRQLRRYKERHSDHHHSHGHKASPTPSTESVLKETAIDGSLTKGKEALLPPPSVRKKYFTMNPITIEQARQQLELIDHDFYLFKDSKTEELKVIYKRSQGGYGLIQELPHEGNK